jgi:hypothetical protein
VEAARELKRVGEDLGFGLRGRGVEGDEGLLAAGDRGGEEEGEREAEGVRHGWGIPSADVYAGIFLFSNREL